MSGENVGGGGTAREDAVGRGASRASEVPESANVPAEDVPDDPEALRRLTVHDIDGQVVGPVTEVYLDDWSRRPEWIAVRGPRIGPPPEPHAASGATEFGAAEAGATGAGTEPADGARIGATEADEPPDAFVPLRDARLEPGGVLRVGYRLDTIERAPALRAEQHLGLDQEQELYVHYGLTTPADESSGAPGVGDDRPKAPLTGRARDDVVAEVRELADEPPAGPPRLRRFVATDPDEATASASGVHGDNR